MIPLWQVALKLQAVYNLDNIILYFCCTFGKFTTNRTDHWRCDRLVNHFSERENHTFLTEKKLRKPLPHIFNFNQSKSLQSMKAFCGTSSRAENLRREERREKGRDLGGLMIVDCVVSQYFFMITVTNKNSSFMF